MDHLIYLPILEESSKLNLLVTTSAPPLSYKSATLAFLEDLILKNVGNMSFNLNSPAHLSHQNLVHLPFPIRIVNLKLNSSQPFLTSFHRFIPKESLTPLVVYPPSCSPFPLHLPEFSMNNLSPQALLLKRKSLHNYLLSKAWLRPSKLLSPSFLYFLSLQDHVWF